MSTAPPKTARPARWVRPMSKPEQSRLVLVATAFTVTTALLVWLLLCAVFPRSFPKATGMLAGWFDTPPGAGRYIPFQPEDARRIGGAFKGGAAMELTPPTFDQELMALVSRAGGEPLVVWLS